MRRRDDLPVVIRRESVADHDAIRSLTARAFATLSFSDGREPLVIEALREANALALSLVAVLDHQIVGHVAFSPMEGAPAGEWFTLGPVSVEPRLRRRGVGSRLIETGLQALRERGASGCVLLGAHDYYRRFGFVVVSALAPSNVPREHFQGLRFGDAWPDAPVAFHAAFFTADDHRAAGSHRRSS